MPHELRRKVVCNGQQVTALTPLTLFKDEVPHSTRVAREHLHSCSGRGGEFCTHPDCPVLEKLERRYQV